MFDREKAIATIEAGRCPCPGCAGALTEDKLSARGWRQPIRQLTEADYDGHDDLEVGDSRFP